MQTRFSFGGDEHIFAEVDEAMSLEAFFKSLFITNAVREAKIKGVSEVCPANASYQVKFDPDVIKPDDLLAEAVRAGMTKINIATQLNKVFTSAVREQLNSGPGVVDPRRYLGAGRDAVVAEVARLLGVLGAGR